MAVKRQVNVNADCHVFKRCVREPDSEDREGGEKEESHMDHSCLEYNVLELDPERH